MYINGLQLGVIRCITNDIHFNPSIGLQAHACTKQAHKRTSCIQLGPPGMAHATAASQSRFYMFTMQRSPYDCQAPSTMRPPVTNRKPSTPIWMSDEGM